MLISNHKNTDNPSLYFVQGCVRPFTKDRDIKEEKKKGRATSEKEIDRQFDKWIEKLSKHFLFDPNSIQTLSKTLLEFST